MLHCIMNFNLNPSSRIIAFFLQDNNILADKITDAHIEEFRTAFRMFDKVLT